jgi:hypothetical protein
VSFLRKLFGIGTAQEPDAGKVSHSMGIPATPEMIRDERQSQAEILRLLEARMVHSDVFLPDKISLLIGRLRDANSPFQRINTDAAFAGETFLSVDEKRKIGLNTRMKYSHAFIACCNPATLASVEPKGALGEMHDAVFNVVSRKRQLSEYQKSGVVRTVRIFPLGDPDACASVRRLKRAYPLNDVPALPLPDCDATCCRCGYDAAAIR